MISSLGDWLLLVLLAGFVGGALSFLIPEGQNRLKDYINLSVSLLLLLILLTPVLKALTGNTDFSFRLDTPTTPLPEDNLFESVVEKEADRLLRERIGAIIEQKFPDAQVIIEPVYEKENEEVTLKCIKLKESRNDGEKIADYLRSLLEIEVILCE